MLLNVMSWIGFRIVEFFGELDTVVIIEPTYTLLDFILDMWIISVMGFVVKQLIVIPNVSIMREEQVEMFKNERLKRNNLKIRQRSQTSTYKGQGPKKERKYK